MAISRNNPLTKGASGMIGNSIVFRTWNGKTYMYNRPSKPKTQSAAQKENRTKFSRAVAFSKKMMAVPEKKAEYTEIAKRENLPNAYTAAVTEYMRKPEILEVDQSSDKEIKVIAKKKGFAIKEVEVVLIGETGEVIQEGTAVRGLADDWIFLLKFDNPQVAEAKNILIKVRDHVDNVVIRRL
jgi:hypothetical protein